VAIEQYLYKTIAHIDVYTEFEMLEVKVPIIFCLEEFLATHGRTLSLATSFLKSNLVDIINH
jgi:hypothetical protein